MGRPVAGARHVDSSVVFRRSKPDAETSAPAPADGHASGKGRPTPTRKEAEAAARARAKVPRTRKEMMAAQEHLWEYYTRVALQRGVQAARNSGKSGIKYAEAYQRVFPQVTDSLS